MKENVVRNEKQISPHERVFHPKQAPGGRFPGNSAKGSGSRPRKRFQQVPTLANSGN